MREKTLYFLILTITLSMTNITKAKQRIEELKGTITLSGAWALYPMAVKWAEEFQKLHPKVRIDIGAGGA